MRRLFAVGLALWLAVAGLLALPSLPAQAQSEPVLGDAPYLQDGAVIAASGTDIVTAASVPAVDISSRAASASFYFSYYTAQPAIGWTGSQASCNAGTTSAEFKAAVIDRIAFYRAMAGVPSSIGLAATSSAADQQAALMFSRNNSLTHNPPSDWACYTETGANAARNSNIALGAYGVSAIDAYMRDAGGNNTAAGHRRWVLYPQTQSFGTGDVPSAGSYMSANALWAWDANVSGPRPSTRDGFVAWPPAGYVPHQIVFPRWSFSWPGANFGSASVSVKVDGSSVPVSIDSRTDNGYGENTIVFQPSSSGWLNGGADTTYTVTISGVSAGGQTRTFTYDVTVFDPGTSGSGTTPTRTPTPASSGFAPGDSFITTNRVNLRSGPSTSTTSLGVLPTGTIGTITGAPTASGGYSWYPVLVSGLGSGWIAGDYLGRASVTATPTPGRTATPSRTPTPSATSVPPTQTRTATPTATKAPPTQTRTPTLIPGGYAPGDFFRTTANLNMRSGPSTSASAVAILPNGSTGQVTGAPVLANGYTWYPVAVNGIGSGWAAGEYFSHVASQATQTPTRTPTRTPIPAATATRAPGSFLSGDIVRSTAAVNFRTGPGTGYDVRSVVPSGSLATVTGDPVNANGYTWYPVTISGAGSGWLASAYLTLVSAGNPPPTQTAVPSGDPRIGSTVYTTANLNIRSGPGTGFSVVGVASRGTAATITAAPVRVGSVDWFPLDVPAIGYGWASGTYLSTSPTVQGPQLPAVSSSEEEPAILDTPTPTASPPPAETPTVVDQITTTPTPTESMESTASAESPPDEDLSEPATPIAEPTESATEEPPTETAPEESLTEVAPAWLPIERVQRSPDSQPGQVLVDADPSTVWFANGAGQPLAMFVLDLGENRAFSQVRWLPGDAGISGTLYLSISDDGEQWFDLDPTLAVSSADGWLVLEAPTSARYVRFVFVNDTGAEWLGGIADVRIMP